MSEITFDTLEKLDDLADGIFTDPWSQKMEKYNLREMAKKAKELGRSHPSRVRGLKFRLCQRKIHFALSHPSWVRGLKF